MIKRQITKEQTMNLLCCVFLRIVYPICCQFENNSRLIRSYDSKMDRQCNGQKKKENRTNNELIVLFFSSYFVPYVTSFPALSIFDCPFVLPVSLHCPFLIVPSVFSNVYMSVSLHCPFLIGLSVFSSVYMSVSLHCPFLIAPSVFSNIYLSVSLHCPFLIVPSVFSNVYLSVSLHCPFLIVPSVFSNLYYLQSTTQRQCKWCLCDW